MAVFPLRIVFMKVENPSDVPVSVLISVPKKRFRHAIDRNRMKRLVREAYRVNKHELCDFVSQQDYNIAVAFVCITDNMATYQIVERSMHKALLRIMEKLQSEIAVQPEA